VWRELHQQKIRVATSEKRRATRFAMTAKVMSGFWILSFPAMAGFLLRFFFGEKRY